MKPYTVDLKIRLHLYAKNPTKAEALARSIVTRQGLTVEGGVVTAEQPTSGRCPDREARGKDIDVSQVGDPSLPLTRR